MPILKRPGGVSIFYEVRGQGIPVLFIAPGGMRSSIPFWEKMPYNPLASLPQSRFCTIAMDQRNAGRSFAPLAAGDGWHTYAGDQLALLDHLGIRRCLLVGSCIGPSYQLRLMRDAPERFPAAVLMQPIGLAEHSTEAEGWRGNNAKQTKFWFDSWADEMQRDGRAERTQLQALQRSMFGGDFVFSIDRDELRSVQAPLLVLMGRDAFHPSATAREVAALAPSARLIEQWADSGEHIAKAAAEVERFLLHHGKGLAPAAPRADAAQQGAGARL
eukprot:TRINITY_DN19278_c0_g1_i1.p1 TRINITY_DN19278_c0_g1~~TRINITY_DN19278_c0_g1_i1.p1  ORF type:complete len:300 (+),score=77.68 TRINITY_DN19278_c0_g1_i1:84-902(+)